MKKGFFVWFLLFSVFLRLNAQTKIEKWGIFEISLQGPAIENPVTGHDLTAMFIHPGDTVIVKGFYDGAGIYKVRFMPSLTGEWQYFTKSSNKKLVKKGKFQCIDPSAANHGPVVVSDTFYFTYADGKKSTPIGTTIYRWLEENEEMRGKTIEAIRNAPFNKVRFKILGPDMHASDPKVSPFRVVNGKTDYGCLNPAYFTAIDKAIEKFGSMGIEADLIFLHPYDVNTLPLSAMSMENIRNYLDYIIARFGAYRNIWWTTNEFDLIETRSMSDWDEILRYIADNDPYHHLLSNHNSAVWYDHTKPWITHASVQNEGWWMSQPLRKQYLKPVIFDEFCYEGDGDNRTVALEGNVLTHRFWLMTVNGSFATHGEAFVQPQTNARFFSKGGELLGNSHKQLHYLKKVLDEAPGQLKPMGYDWRLNNILCGSGDKFFLYYFGEYQNKLWDFTELPANLSYKVQLLNTRTGETSLVEGVFRKNDRITLPGKPYFAMILRKLE